MYLEEQSKARDSYAPLKGTNTGTKSGESLCDPMQSTLSKIFHMQKRKAACKSNTVCGMYQRWLGHHRWYIERSYVRMTTNRQLAQTSVQVPAAANGPHLSNGKTGEWRNSNRWRGQPFYGWLDATPDFSWNVALELHVKMT